MTRYKILRSNDLIEVEIKEHAGYADKGYDIVCASISTAITMTINAIDNLGYNVLNYQKQDGYISFKVKSNDVTSSLIKTLEECLNVLSEDYPNYINSK